MAPMIEIPSLAQSTMASASGMSCAHLSHSSANCLQQLESSLAKSFAARRTLMLPAKPVQRQLL